MSRAARSIAVLVSAVLGAGLGVVAGTVVADGSHVEDPLGLEIAMVNQPCTDKAVLIVGQGDTATALAPATAEDDSTRYLETSKSCAITWGTNSQKAVRYVAYLGPYSRDRACAERMTADHRGDRVMVLSSDRTEPLQCACYLYYRDMPVLRTGSTPTSLDIVYINALQQMLSTLHRRPDVASTSVYDLQTADQVRRLQADVGLTTTGVTDADTWKAVLNRACPRY